MGRVKTALVFTASACLLAACGVGTYHIPDVPPVVKPEPEKDMFEGLMEEEGEEAPASESTAPKAEPSAEPAAPAAPAEAEKPAEPAAGKPAPAPSKPAPKKK